MRRVVAGVVGNVCFDAFCCVFASVHLVIVFDHCSQARACS